VGFISYTKSLAKADARDYLIILLGLVYENKFIVGQIIRDRVGEADYMPVIYTCGVNVTPLKLVNESLIMIGSHTRPATITNLAVEDVY
jgi:hypothetical protein